MNKINSKNLAAVVLAGAVTIIFYVACAAVLWMLSEVMMV